MRHARCLVDTAATSRKIGPFLMPSDAPTICAMCNQLVATGAAYVVRIEVFAEPTTAEVKTEAMADVDYRAEIDRLIAELSEQSAAEAQDQVHRQFAFQICGRCQRRYLENPLPAP